MKSKFSKTCLFLTLVATTAFANANDEINSVFNNNVSNQVVEHTEITVDKVTSILEKPTRQTLESTLGKNAKILNTKDTETWYYGVNMAVSPTAKEKCVVAFIFDKESNQTQADLISFDNSRCEQAIESAQTLTVEK